MQSFKLDEKGDFVIDSLGKIVIIEDLDVIAQSIRLRFSTVAGELFYSEEWGRNILNGKQNEDTVKEFIEATILQDERVDSVEITSVNLTTIGRYDISVLIYLNTDETLDLDFTL
jgi:hypothetical protein